MKDNTSFDPIGTVQELDPPRRRAAVRRVATAATNAEDCALLLSMLGLDANEGLAAVDVKAA